MTGHRVLPLFLILSACGGKDAAENASAAAPVPGSTGAAPRTPTMNVQTLPGNEAEWMEPRPANDDPRTAPYANLLDQPVVNATSR